MNPLRPVSAALLLAAIVLGACSSRAATPPPTPEGPPLSGPVLGSKMAWVDGSTLVFIPTNQAVAPYSCEGTGTCTASLDLVPTRDRLGSSHAGGFWVNLNPISLYQYQLCVQAGACEQLGESVRLQLSVDALGIVAPVDIAGIISPMEAAPTGGEGTALPAEVLAGIASPRDAASLTPADVMVLQPTDWLDFTGEAAQGALRTPDPWGYDAAGEYCSWMGGHIPTDTDQALLMDLSRNEALGGASMTLGIRCVLEDPTPRPMYAFTTPYYDPASGIAEMQAEITRSETFCQAGNGFQVMEFSFPPGHSLAAASGDGNTECEVLDAGRIICGGVPGESSIAHAEIPCSGLENVFHCPAGSALEPMGGEASPLGCATGEQPTAAGAQVDYFLPDENGALHPQNAIELAGGGWVGSSAPTAFFLSGILIGLNLPASGAAGAASGITPSDLQGIVGPSDSRSPYAAASPCPFGAYFDGGANACATLGPSEAACLGGYEFDSGLLACRQAADQPYPGCPPGQIFDIGAGLCDTQTQIISAQELIHTQLLQIELPECSRDRTEPEGPPDFCPNCP